MQRFLTILFFLALFSTASIAQSSGITGQIWDKTHTPLIGVNITSSTISTGTISDENGMFELAKVPAGEHTITLSYIGYKTKEIVVSVSANQNVNLGNITMYEGNELLQEVTVTAARKNQFSRKSTAYVSKLPMRDMENPVVYSTVTTELLESQVVTNFDDAMVNATGISKLWEATGRSPGEGTGYFSTRGFATQPSLVDGMPGFTFSAIDPSYIERIEVVKGPSATLFGSTVTSLGGLINVVTKKPYQGFGGSVSYTAGSFGMHRATVDVNTPLGKKDNVFFRINGSYLTQDSWQDAGFRNSFFIAPSLSYRVNNRLNLSLGVEYSRTEQTNPSMLFLRRGIPLVSKNVDDLGVDPNQSFTSDDVTLTSPILNSRAIADYKISDKWNSQTVFVGTYSAAYGHYQYMTEGAAAAFGVLAPLAGVPEVDQILAETNALMQRDAFVRIIEERDGKGTKYNVQQNFTGDFNIGKLRNRLVLGLDFVARNNTSDNIRGNNTLVNTPIFSSLNQTLTFLESVGQVPPNTAAGLSSQLSAFPYFDAMFDAKGALIPTIFTPDAVSAPTTAQLDAAFDGRPGIDAEWRSKTYAAYVSDVLNITKDLTLHVGLRVDHFDQDGEVKTELDDFEKTTLSPTAGIVYHLLPKKLTLFSNYQTGFINNNPVVNQNGTTQTFEPTKARQIEGGIKTNLFNGKLNAGISYYHITVNDFINSDPRAPLFPISISLEELVSQGVEVEFNANPVKGLNLRASYAYNDKETTNAYSETTDIRYDELEGRRPEDGGPQNIYNFWADYKFEFSDNKFLKNLGVGAGFNGASEHLTINNGIAGEFTLPSYTIFNAALYYNAEKFRVGLKVNNLTDEIYYKGWSTVNAQAPRAIIGTVSYKF